MSNEEVKKDEKIDKKVTPDKAVRIELTKTKEQNVSIKVLVNTVVTVDYDGEKIILQPKSINKGYKRSKLRNINKNEILVMVGGL